MLKRALLVWGDARAVRTCLGPKREKSSENARLAYGAASIRGNYTRAGQNNKHARAKSKLIAVAFGFKANNAKRAFEKFNILIEKTLLPKKSSAFSPLKSLSAIVKYRNHQSEA